jgi:hypothetical protein
MLLACYFLRYILTRTFIIQTEAEIAKDEIVKIFDNMPDAILLIDGKIKEKVNVQNGNRVKFNVDKVGAVHFDLLYCNKHADNLYKTKLSRMPPNQV